MDLLYISNITYFFDKNIRTDHHNNFEKYNIEFLCIIYLIIGLTSM